MGESFRLLRPPQAQEYADAKWALGLRLHDATDDAIGKSVNRGDILRTHIMRPLAHLVMHAELEALVTSGPRRGKQFTYMLLEERVPPARMLGGEEALAELTRRYFYQPRPRDAARLRLVVGSHRGRRPAGVWRSSGRRSSTRPSGLSSTPSPRPQRTIVDPAPQFLPWFDEYTVAY